MRIYKLRAFYLPHKYYFTQRDAEHRFLIQLFYSIVFLYIYKCRYTAALAVKNNQTSLLFLARLFVY